mgnify:CR=1 FL=1
MGWTPDPVDIILSTVRPPADDTAAVQVLNAAGSDTVLDIDTTNGRVGIGTSAPDEPLTVQGAIHSTADGFVFPDGSVQTTASFFGNQALVQQNPR